MLKSRIRVFQHPVKDLKNGFSEVALTASSLPLSIYSNSQNRELMNIFIKNLNPAADTGDAVQTTN
ncbi:MAG: hypothetical protein A2087_09915 [Spirochaetes bacterium GWD1_61_31]|nr:MAG: hypothetical protein A2Y37_07210 [Spirochaetes bacterium GWB1_60_80]OHD34008.1 MAG: hypothetical protein A2004_02140 [Spirochaetes bacterium GWC1_61_12]OHD41551.1 MAG: hypothetical protein A2087_09915 [Spirochaetes bacterium GWD1_61_31]OHD59185.1 MAG: hypothetical protein A2Y32_00170 [Spirochaetes bacterium GWF1_60_12]